MQECRKTDVGVFGTKVREEAALRYLDESSVWGSIRPL